MAEMEGFKVCRWELGVLKRGLKWRDGGWTVRWEEAVKDLVSDGLVFARLILDVNWLIDRDLVTRSLDSLSCHARVRWEGCWWLLVVSIAVFG